MALVLVRLEHLAVAIVNADHRITSYGRGGGVGRGRRVGVNLGTGVGVAVGVGVGTHGQVTICSLAGIGMPLCASPPGATMLVLPTAAP